MIFARWQVSDEVHGQLLSRSFRGLQWLELTIGVIMSHIGKLIVGAYDHPVANIVVNLGPMIVPLDQLKDPFFAKMAGKWILMEVGE